MKTLAYETIFFLSLLTGAAAVLAGCTLAELKETGSNAGGAVGDAFGAVAADPSNAFTPQGLAVLLATFFTGLFSRQAASVAKWVGTPTAGWLVRVLGKFVTIFKK